MSWIELPGDESSPELEEITRPWRKDGLPTVVAAMKNSPKALKAVMGMNMSITFGASTLGRRTEELIATQVSAYNECFY